MSVRLIFVVSTAAALLAASVFAFVSTTSGSTETGYFTDVTATHVPHAPGLHLLDAEFADVDGDGDLDIVGAVEWEVNRLYINDGQGRFTWRKNAFNDQKNDTEDVHLADFNQDGEIDVLFVAEDGKAHEFYLGRGGGVFRDATSQLPVRSSKANAVEAGDVDGDGRLEVFVGNSGKQGHNFVWRYDVAAARFVDITSTTLPGVKDNTQDLELGDVDGDGDLDLAIANDRPPNRLLINNGSGAFEEDPKRLDITIRMKSRETVLFDADGDGDRDLLFCNVPGPRAAMDPQARLLINDGNGWFSDETAARLPVDTNASWDCGAMDVDGDGDVDVLMSATIDPGFKPLRGRVWLNDGQGKFTDGTEQVMPATAQGRFWDFEIADLNKDGIEDVFIGGWGTQARLLLGKRP